MEQQTLEQLTKELGFECSTDNIQPNSLVTGAYASDLLSDVMGKAQAGSLWITSQVHKNIVAVASLKELSAIVIANERSVPGELRQHASDEDVVILSSNLPLFETCGKIFNYLNA